MDPRIHIDRTNVLMTSDYRVGCTLTQRVTNDPWPGTEEARELASWHLSRMKSAWFVQHLGTWGIDLNKVWTGPDSYDWTLFDRRMQWIVDQGLENVVIGCYGAPFWATLIGKHPTYQRLNPDLEQSWALFCCVAIDRALTLGVPVKIACCWNEMKGDGTGGGDWDMIAYTRRYNTWYRTLRAHPRLHNVELAGPYFPIENTLLNDVVVTGRNLSALDYWYENAIDADRIAIDHALSHSNSPALPRDKAIRQADMFGLIAVALNDSYSAHPIMMMEGYVQSDLKRYADYDIDFQAAWSFERMKYELLSRRVSHSFSWGLTGDGRYAPGGCIASWLADTRPLSDQGLASDQGIIPGDKTPLYDVYRAFHEHAGPGQRIYHAQSSDPRVSALATDTATLIANRAEEPLTVHIDTEYHHLGRYQVEVLHHA